MIKNELSYDDIIAEIVQEYDIETDEYPPDQLQRLIQDKTDKYSMSSSQTDELMEFMISKGLKLMLLGVVDRGALTESDKYVVAPDKQAKLDGLTRVIDDSGEDYLYPSSWFKFDEEDPYEAAIERIRNWSPEE